MKYAASSLLVILALACLSEAGLLKTIGKGTENLGSTINQHAIKVEDKLSNLFSKKKEEEEEKPAAAVASKPAVPAVPSKSAEVPPPAVVVDKAQPIDKKHADAPMIEIVYGKPAAPTTKSSLAAAVITDDSDVPEAVPKSAANGPQDEREIIMGAVRCAPNEVFVNSACRPSD